MSTNVPDSFDSRVSSKNTAVELDNQVDHSNHAVIAESTVLEGVSVTSEAVKAALVARTNVLPVEHETSSILNTINRNTELLEAEFPQPLHGYWDLDLLVEKNGSQSLKDELPNWVRSLSETEANRLHILFLESSNDTSRRAVLDEFFEYTATEFATDERKRNALITELIQNESQTKEFVKKWLERHVYAGLPEQSGVYIHKPGFLRSEEQKQLMKPNLHRIIQHHFERVNLPAHERRLVDIGTWDGGMPTALQDQFGSMIGVEPNSKRFDQLESNAVPHLHGLHTDMQSIVENPAQYDLTADAILFSHVMYFFQQSDIDTEALRWAMSNLHKNGIAIIVLNDTQSEPASRAHMRKQFGVRESAGTPFYYKQMLENIGVTTRMMRPSLHIKAHTHEGKVAMRDIMRFMLPGETRHNKLLLDAYQAEIDANGGVLKHTLNILVAYKTSDSAPHSINERSVAIPNAPSKKVVSHETKVHDAKLQLATQQANETVQLEVIGNKVKDLTPKEIVQLVEKIGDSSWGDDHKTHEILAQIEVPYYLFRLWIEDIDQYTLAAKILECIDETETIPSDVRIDAKTLRLVLTTLEKRFTTKKEFTNFLRTIGLYSRYYTKQYTSKPKKIKSATLPQVTPTQIITRETKEPKKIVEPTKVTREQFVPVLPENQGQQLLVLRQKAITQLQTNDAVLSVQLLEYRAALIQLIAK